MQVDQKTQTWVAVDADEQVSAELAGETVILSMKDGQYYGLAEVGALVWRLLRTPCTIDFLVESVQAEYEVDSERCRQDVRELLDELQRRGLAVCRPCAD